MKKLLNVKQWDNPDLHLKTDTLKRADVFEKFRKTPMQSLNLDPAHYMYVSLRGFS